MPVGWRSASAASISDKVATDSAAISPTEARDAAAKRFLAAPSATVSTSVFQPPQCGHLPCQRGLVPPHSPQV